MTKFFSSLLIVGLVAVASVHAANPYEQQGSKTLVPNILNLGYSPDQLNLVVLTEDAQNTFTVYEGLRLNSQRTITIQDEGQFNKKPTAFAFSKDKKWLAIGTSYGALYAFGINQGKIASDWTYKSNIATTGNQQEVKSISFSNGGLIAVAAKDLLVILQAPDNPQAKQFTKKRVHNFTAKLSAVAWKKDSSNIVIAGGQGATPIFHIYNVQTDTPTPIQTATQKTTSIGVFPDGDETILQGRLDKDIQVYKWDADNSNYVAVRSIASSLNATEISVTDNGQYFGAQVIINGVNQVRAWKSNVQVSTENNLKNNNIQSITQEQYLLVGGVNLAMTSDGNRILTVNKDSEATYQNLCPKGQFYNLADDSCIECTGDCKECFNQNDCNSCKDNTVFIDDNNKCVSCSQVSKGCSNCDDSKTCTNCNENDHYQPFPIGNICSCKPAYYKAQDGSCAECSQIKFCKLCSGANTCEKCDDQIQHLKPDAEAGKCKCDDGWYLDDVGCKDCTSTPGCKICQSATNCIICDTGNNWIPDGNGNCICATGFWRNGDSCQPCNRKTDFCDECQQDGTCKICQDKRVVNSTTKQCDCQNKTYSEPDTAQCLPCDTTGQCVHCEATGEHTCVQCDTSLNFKKQPVNGECLCIGGYSKVGDVCVDCQVPGCQNCDGQNDCDRCFQDRNFDPTPVDGKCNCLQGYLPETDGSYCLTCGQKITGCLTCQTLEACTECNAEANFIPEPNPQTKQCDCIQKHIRIKQKCMACSALYKNCDTCNAQQCLNCQANHYINENKTKCLTCEEAMPGCSKCDNVNTCDTCNTQGHWVLSQQTKKCHCKQSFFESDKKCQTCSSKYTQYCNKCSAQQCLNCQDSFILNGQKNQCICPAQQVVKDGRCEDDNGLSPLAIIAIIVGILAVAGAAVAIIKCLKKRQSPLQDGEYQALEGQK